MKERVSFSLLNSFRTRSWVLFNVSGRLFATLSVIELPHMSLQFVTEELKCLSELEIFYLPEVEGVLAYFTYAFMYLLLKWHERSEVSSDKLWNTAIKALDRLLFANCASTVTKLALLSFFIYVHWTPTVFTTVPFALLWIIGNPQFNTVFDRLVCCSRQVVGVRLGSGSSHRLIMPAGHGSLYLSCCCCHSGWRYKSHLFSVTAETRVEITAQSTLPAIAASWMLTERSLIKQQVSLRLLNKDCNLGFSWAEIGL